MKMCDMHHEVLKKAIEDRGLMGLVSKDGETAVESLKSSLEGSEDLSNYDPLLNASFMICSRALQSGGIDLLMADGEGENEICPLCEAKKGGESEGYPGLDLHWVEGCTDSILKFCQDNKLVGGVQ